MAPKVLVVGSAMMELSLNLYEIPAPGGVVADDGGVAYLPSGKGTNIAVALSRLGAVPYLCTKLSADLHGSIIYDFYRKMGIDCSYITVERDADLPTALTVNLRENSSGKERKIVYPGVSARINQENIFSAFSVSPDGLFASLDAGCDAALSAMKIAAGKGTPVFFDTYSSDRSVPLENFPESEIVFFNERTSELYSGITPTGADSSLRASLALWRRVKAKYIVIKQGARGASVYDGKHFDMISPKRVDKTVDTSFAGDTFTAALVAEYLKCRDVKLAAKYGAAAAALAVSRQGTVSSVPTEDEVRAIMTRQ